MKQFLASLLAIACLAQLGLTVMHRAGYQIAIAQSNALPAASQPSEATTKEERQSPQSIQAPASDASSRDRASIDRAAIIDPSRQTPSTQQPRPAQPSTEVINEERDPFVPYYSINRNRDSNDLSPLTQIDISELRLAAVIKDSTGSYAAAVQNAQGRNFILKRGARIGNRGGQVVEITSSKVIISEIQHNAVGKKTAHFREIAMKTAPDTKSLVR
jgi:Tfp pilus assembly protein PilP